MSIHTNLQGRLRNTSLSKSHGLLPVFEAVVNSIHSIEEKGNLGTQGQVTLELIRSSQTSLELDTSNTREIIGFEIRDNGIGFDDANMDSFETLDSDHKIDKGCRGVGRLLWLKAFALAEVSSVYRTATGEVLQRTFTFDAKHGVRRSEPTKAKEGTDTHTLIKLDGFEEGYRNLSPKTARTIADALLEHCLWYFVRGDGAPQIFVKDGEERIALYDLYDQYMHSSAQPESIDIKGQPFDLTHIKFRASASKKHSMSLCAAKRLVKEESIQGKIPGLYGKITDASGDFIYACYVSSPYLDERVRSERTSFDIAESFDGIFANTEITLKDIREQVIERSKIYLNDFLAANVKAGRERVDGFVSTKAPRYRPIISYIDEQELSVDPSISDKDLELHLYKHWTEVERKLLEEGHDLTKPLDSENLDGYEERLKEYLLRAADLKKSDLANYVSHRRVILDILEQSIKRLDNGKYAREDLIHELIMPMGKDSNEVFLDSCNLWLIDERLAFHNYLASDKTLNSMPITGDTSTKEPDICALNVCDNPILVSEKQSLPLATITVIEIKRPMRNDAKAGEEKDPIEQALGYLDRIRSGTAKTANGLLIPKSDEIPGYCYVICDLTESVVQRCKIQDLTPTSDHMGYFGYNKNFKAYIEVISYNQLVQAAKERNRAFFDKLGFPCS